MLSKFNPWQGVVALAILAGMVTALVVTGHKADLTVATTGFGGLALALLNVLKAGGQ